MAGELLTMGSASPTSPSCLVEPNGTRSVNWKVVLYRTRAGMLQTLKAAIERFRKP
jgi:hypothetical protein